MTWKQCYLYGDETAIQEAIDLYPAEGLTFFDYVSYARELKDEETDAYGRIAGDNNVLRGAAYDGGEAEDALSNIEEASSAMVYLDTDAECLRCVYPEHFTGQSIPIVKERPSVPIVKALRHAGVLRFLGGTCPNDIPLTGSGGAIWHPFNGQYFDGSTAPVACRRSAAGPIPVLAAFQAVTNKVASDLTDASWTNLGDRTPTFLGDGVYQVTSINDPTNFLRTDIKATTSPGEEVCFSFFAKRGTANDATARIYRWGPNEDISFSINGDTPSGGVRSYYDLLSADEWRRIDIRFTAPASFGSLLVYISSDYLGGSPVYGTTFYKSIRAHEGANPLPFTGDGARAGDSWTADLSGLPGGGLGVSAAGINGIINYGRDGVDGVTRHFFRDPSVWDRFGLFITSIPSLSFFRGDAVANAYWTRTAAQLISDGYFTENSLEFPWHKCRWRLASRGI